MLPQDVVNQVNQLSRQIKPISDQMPLATGERQAQLTAEYGRLNSQRNDLLSSVPGLRETYEKGQHGYLYVNRMAIPDAGLSYDELRTWQQKDAEASARNIYEGKPGATLPEPSAAYKADVAKTEGIQINPDTKAVEAKPGYQISQAGEVSRKPEAPPKPEPEKLPPTTDIAGVRVDEGLVLFKGDSQWRKASDYSINNRVLEGNTLRDLGEQLTREPVKVDESERIRLPGMSDNEWLPRTDWNKIPPNQQEIAKAKGLDGLKEAVAKAENTLSDFRNEDGSYNLSDALNERNGKVDDAVALLFSTSDIEKAKYENKPALTIGTGQGKQPTSIKFQKAPEATAPLSSDQVTATSPQGDSELAVVAARTGGGLARIADATKQQITRSAGDLVKFLNSEVDSNSITYTRADADRIKAQVAQFAVDTVGRVKAAGERINEQNIDTTKVDYTRADADKVKAKISEIVSQAAEDIKVKANIIGSKIMDVATHEVTPEEEAKIDAAINNFVKTSVENAKAALQNYAETHSGATPEQLRETQQRNYELSRGNFSKMGAVAITAAPATGGLSIPLILLAAGATALAGHQLRKIVNELQSSGRTPTDADVVVYKDGQAFGILSDNMRNKGLSVPPLTPPVLPQVRETIKPITEHPVIPGYRTPEIEPYYEGIKAVQPEIVVFTTPAIRPEDITGRVAGLLVAQAKTEAARTDYNDAVSKIDWGSVVVSGPHITKGTLAKTPTLGGDISLKDKMGLKSSENIDSAIKAAEMSPSSEIRGQAHFVRKAYSAYQMKLAALEAAKHSYISFMDPKPVKGTLSQQSLSAIAGYKLAQSLGTRNAKATSLEQALAQSTATKSVVKAGQLAYTMAKTQGLTDTQADMKAQQAVRSAVKSAVSQATREATKSATRSATRTATQGATRTATNTATASRTATNTRTATRANTRTATRDLTRTQELTRTAELTTTGIPILKLKKKDKPEKEWTRTELESATAFRMGALGKPPKPVTIALRSPYGPGDKKVFVGETPEGLHVAPNAVSAKKTIQLLHGPSPANVTTKIGFQTVRISRPSRQPGVRGAISFTPEKSVRVGQVYRTNVSGGTIVSRFPIKHRRGRR